MNGKNRTQRLALLGAFGALAPLAANAQIDYGFGTNAVVSMAGTMNTAASVMSPLTIGLILFGLAIGVALYFARKAGVRK